MVEISTSILPVINEKETTKIFYNLEVAHTDYFHIDVMDGKFVENNTSEKMLEFATVIKQISNIPLDVHLMVENVKEYINEYILLEPNIITFHYEALKNKEEIYELIKYIKEHNIKVGLSIKPNTNIEEIYEFLPYLHMVLIMTVEPGKGGQGLILETLEKSVKLKQYLIEQKLDLDIEADGGIKLENIKQIKKAGVDIAVVGTGILKTENYAKTIKDLKTF